MTKPQALSSMIAQIFQLGPFTSRPRMEHKLSMKLAERTEGVEGRGRASERRKSSREQSPFLPATRTGDAPVPADEVATEVCLGSRQPPQSFQSGAPSRQLRYLQATPRCRTGRVGRRRGLGECCTRDQCAYQRQVAVRLTAPICSFNLSKRLR